MPSLLATSPPPIMAVYKRRPATVTPRLLLLYSTSSTSTIDQRSARVQNQTKQEIPGDPASDGAVVSASGGAGRGRRVDVGEDIHGAGRAADQVPGRPVEAVGLHGLRDGARGHAVGQVLRRHGGDAEGAARVPLLHHPAGAQRHPRRPEPRPPLRPPPRPARRLQARARQRLPLHQPTAPDPELTRLRYVRKRLQRYSVPCHPRERHRQRLQGSDGDRLRRRGGGRGLRGLLVHLLISREPDVLSPFSLIMYVYFANKFPTQQQRFR